MPEQPTTADDTPAQDATEHVFTVNPLFVDRSNPSRLLPWVFLSGCAFAREHAAMRALGITAVANLTPDDFGCADAGFKVLHLTIDDATAPPRERRAIHRTMQSWEASGDVVLIHCHAGISRTSAFAIAWLMHTRGANAQSDLLTMWSTSEDIVGAVRPIIMPHYLLKRAVIQHFAERAA
jgi:predicted protein tyrosine phosphatase